VLVPASVQKLPVLCRGSCGYQNDKVPALDQLLSQWFMVIGRGFQAEYDLPKAMLHLERVRLDQKLLEALIGIIKEHPFVQRTADRCAEKSVVPFLGNVQSNDQIFRRTANLFLELTKFPQPDTICIVHERPPVLNLVSG
jgi:hypothetical protein